MEEFVRLKEQNERLANENSRLLKELILLSNNTVEFTLDSSYLFDVTPMKVINHSLHSVRNRLTLHFQTKDSLKAPMGLINENGVIGIITNINGQYALANSLLNIDTKISVSIKSSGYFGSLSWPGRRYDDMRVTGIPKHADMQIGDTIVTNGYSTIFPKGIPVGVIKDFKLDRTGDFFDISCTPTVSFGKLKHVYGLSNPQRDEIIIVEDE